MRARYIYTHVRIEQSFHLIQLIATMMFILQNIYMICVPLAMILTTIAMLLPCWWSSETLQVGLWRARSVSSSWITIEPNIDTPEGRYLQRNECTFESSLHSRSSSSHCSNSFIYFNHLHPYEYIYLVIHSSSSYLSLFITATSLISSIHYCDILLFIIVTIFRLAFHDNTTQQFHASLLFILSNIDDRYCSHILIDQHID